MLVNGFFVAAEFAFVRANRGRLELMAATNRRAALALRQLDDISHYLASCQFGITLASLGIGFLGEPAIASIAEPLLGSVVSEAVAIVIALLLAYVISTAAHITVGEQVPKMFAIANAPSDRGTRQRLQRHAAAARRQRQCRRRAWHAGEHLGFLASSRVATTGSVRSRTVCAAR